eukprot:1194878-Prorocentrum_minimum.AAC.1
MSRGPLHDSSESPRLSSTMTATAAALRGRNAFFFQAARFRKGKATVADMWSVPLTRPACIRRVDPHQLSVVPRSDRRERARPRVAAGAGAGAGSFGHSHGRASVSPRPPEGLPPPEGGGGPVRLPPRGVTKSGSTRAGVPWRFHREQGLHKSSFISRRTFFTCRLVRPRSFCAIHPGQHPGQHLAQRPGQHPARRPRGARDPAQPPHSPSRGRDSSRATQPTRPPAPPQTTSTAAATVNRHRYRQPPPLPSTAAAT